MDSLVSFAVKGDVAVQTDLSLVEARVLGCLIEKSMATPEYYPLTVNSLLAACNQKSNRDPVMSLLEGDVASALDELRYREHLVWIVDQAGSRVPKYRHSFAERIPVELIDMAVLCELMLRGPQTSGELRSRVGRLCGEQSPEAITDSLKRLAEREDEPLVALAPRVSGRRGVRFAHLLCGAIAMGDPEATDPNESTDGMEGVERRSPLQQRVDALEERVSELGSELEELRGKFDQFTAQFES